MSDEQVFVHRKSDSFAKVPYELIIDKRISDGAVRQYAYMHWRYGNNHDNHEGRASIAKSMGVSQATVSKRIIELEAAGWVVVIERKKAGTNEHDTNLYHVFEVTGNAKSFRDSHEVGEFEFMRPQPDMPTRKSRKGVGGRPTHQAVETQVNPDPEKPELDTVGNSSSRNPYASDPDAKDSDATAPEPDPPTPKAKPRKPKDDPLFEALCECANGVPYDEATDGQKSYTRAVMREVNGHPDLRRKPPTVEEVSTLRQRYAAANPGLTFPDNPRKFAKWLADLRPSKQSVAHGNGMSPGASLPVVRAS